MTEIQVYDSELYSTGLSKIGANENLGGGRRFIRDYEKSSFYDFEKWIMQEGCCPYILPMCFVQEDEIITVYYDFTGYRLLKDDIKLQLCDELEKRGTRQLLCQAVDILADILENLKDMENHLLFPERLHLDIDGIFIHTVSRKAVFSYIPKRRNEDNFEKQLFTLLEDIKLAYHYPEIDQCCDRLINFMKENNPGLDGLISNLGMIQRELSYVYNHSEHFRVNSFINENPAEEKESDENGSEKSNFRIGKKSKKRTAAIKVVLLQLTLILIVTTIFLTSGLSISQLAGLISLGAGVDLWLIKKFNLKGQSSATM